MAVFSFDTSTVAPSEKSFDLLPAGWYTAQVTESSVEPLKSGNGDALKLTLEVLDPQFRGRKIWARLNVRHSNSEAERIAQQQLRDLCTAIGIARFADTAELHYKPLQVRVKVRRSDNPQYDDSNEVSGFRAAGTAGAPAGAPAAARPPAFPPQAPAVASPPAAAPAAATPPWLKKTAA